MESLRAKKPMRQLRVLASPARVTRWDRLAIVVLAFLGLTALPG